MFKDQMQQDVIMVLKFPSNSPVTHVAANTLPHLTMPAVVTVTCSRLFAVNRWNNTVGKRSLVVDYSLHITRFKCNRTWSYKNKKGILSHVLKLKYILVK